MSCDPVSERGAPTLDAASTRLDGEGLVIQISLEACPSGSRRGEITIRDNAGRVVASDAHVRGSWSSDVVVLESGAEYLTAETVGFGSGSTEHLLLLAQQEDASGIDPFAAGILVGVVIPAGLALLRAVFVWRRSYLLSLAGPVTRVRRALAESDVGSLRDAYQELGNVTGLSGWAARLHTAVGEVLDEGFDQPGPSRSLVDKILRRHSWTTR